MSKYVSKPVQSDGTIDWNETEHSTWSTLIDRQNQIVEKYACQEFIDGLNKLNFSKTKIPQLGEINEILDGFHGWGVQGVPAIIQPKEFFELLANKRFPAATFIREPKELDYLQEPDIFHEIYGHTPLLINKSYCEFMEKFGQVALNFKGIKRRKLFRLFWFTIEFGMIKSKAGELKAYGSGILSSIGETKYCVTDKPVSKPLNTLDALRTPFRVDIMQPLYYYLNDFSDLFEILNTDINALLDEANKLGDLPALFKKHSDEIKGAMSC